MLLLVLMIGLGVYALPQSPAAHAGSNGQQLMFFVPSGFAKINWLYVKGTYYTGSPVTWSKTINPAVSSYDLTNYWWKGATEIKWRLANGVSGSCTINVPQSMTGNWIAVDLSRYGGRGCYPSR